MHEYLPNLRDIGGMPALDGSVVRRGMVLRSAMPAPADIAPPTISWPPRVVIDLRSPAETEAEHPLLSCGARVVRLPLLSALRPGSAPPEDLAALYRVMVDYADELLLELVREVSRSEGPTLIHCAAGKDRTGVSIALILRLLGVDREHVVDDFLASARSEAAIAARLGRMPDRDNRKPVPAHFLAVPVEAINGVLDYWDEHDGGTEGWLRSAGSEPDLVDRLRSTLLT